MELAAENPPEEAEFRFATQFTEPWRVRSLAEMAESSGLSRGFDPKVVHPDNTRTEEEKPHYEASDRRIVSSGLKPSSLDEETVEGTLLTAIANRERILPEFFTPQVNWRNPSYK